MFAVIYLDNAATTYPKPVQVYQAWNNAMRSFGANPGRGGYPFAAATSEAVYGARSVCGELFGAEAENVAFTLNCTHALNYAVKGLGRRGVHYVISDLEHNAVLRPVHACAAHYGGSYSMFETADDDELTLARAERAIRSDTAAMICTAASNVTGKRLPIAALGELCKRRGIPLVVDAAQGAGVLPLKLGGGVSVICAAGHKGLYGPMGTGLLVTDGLALPRTIIEGGTGSASEQPLQPDFTPDRFESGTINTAGAIALGEGVRFVMAKGTDVILRHELEICRRFCEGMRKIHGVRLYSDMNGHNLRSYAPVVSFNLDGWEAARLSEELGRQGFCLRAGLHCAPLAHRKLGTLDGGTVRFAPSVFTSEKEADMLLRAVEGLARKK